MARRDMVRDRVPARAKKRGHPLCRAALWMLLLVLAYAIVFGFACGLLRLPEGLFEPSPPSSASMLSVAAPHGPGGQGAPAAVYASAPEIPEAGAPPQTAAPQSAALSPALQNPELPNGCEATSLCNLLRLWGFDADKQDIALNYIPAQPFTADESGARLGPDPAVAYAGDPADSGGFYCLAAPAAQGGAGFLAGEGSSLVCADISGTGTDELAGYLAEGRPLMLWVTLDLAAPRRAVSGWQLPNGEYYTPYANLHCVVAYAAEGGELLVLDPLKGDVRMDAAAVWDSYEALGGQAVAIY